MPENFKESSDPIADFTFSLIEISKECIPQISTNPTKSNPWYNDDCKEAIKQRKQALSKFKPPSLLTALPWFGGLIRTGDFIFE